MPHYTGVRLREDITIDKLYTVHYFEYPKNFSFPGESHDFWEFVYVDKGQITALTDRGNFLLRRGDIIFHKPDEWHSVSAGEEASNIVIVSFASDSPAMDFFEGRLLKAGQYQKQLMSKIITEYTKGFSTPLGDPLSSRNIRRENPVIGSEQLTKQYLCELLIMFIRNYYTEGRTMLAGKNADSVLELARQYMTDNIGSRLTLGDIARHCGTGTSTLSSVFAEHCGMGAIDYFIRMKIDAAKEYIREENYNITQISEILGYSSIHYFSRQFKKITGMSPGEYSASVRAMLSLHSRNRQAKDEYDFR
ncbi:MAG: helix-turn-helix transcriptional regulator [Clostridia bacterium]|nr:helix-turn-helix transcriptional regulator [Clostridia bacterium]